MPVSKRGGARKGAGRKRKYPEDMEFSKVRVPLKLKDKYYKWLEKQLAKK
jgi:hypothetical protein